MKNNGHIETGLVQDIQLSTLPLDYSPFPEFSENYLPENVRAHFHFAPHRTAEQFDEGSVLLETADIFIPEAAGWTEQTHKDLTAISKGDPKKLAKLCAALATNDNADFIQATCRSLYGTYKPVILIDADASRKDLRMTDLAKWYERAIHPDVETTLQELARELAKVASLSYQRDLVMGENLGAKVTKLVSGHPRLATKDHVQVLLSLGFTHTQLYEALSTTPGLEEQVTASTWTGLTSIDVESRIVGEYKDGKTPATADIEEFLIAKALGGISISLLGKEPVYDFNGSYYRDRTLHSYVGDTMIRMIKAQGHEGVSLAHRFLRRSMTDSDKTVLVELAKAAQDEVNTQYSAN